MLKISLVSKKFFTEGCKNGLTYYWFGRSFVDVAQKSFSAVAEKYGDGRTGGFLHISELVEGRLELHGHLRLGIPNPEKWRNYVEYSREKPGRLAAQFSFYGIYNDEVHLSYQSRDPDSGLYAGAVLCRWNNRFIIVSFSGLPEMVDEAFCMALQTQTAMRSPDEAEKILMSYSAGEEQVELFRKVHNTIGEVM